jgi:hypothetical protein
MVKKPTMRDARKLSRSMSVEQFDNGYWFATELKAFAKSIGIESPGKLRKDELEAAIKRFLREGSLKSTVRRSLSRKGIKDVERGLRPGLLVVLYTNDKATKDFLEREAKKLSPDYRRRSGARYRINRWREEQLTKGNRITYAGLVAEYVRLSRPEVRYAKVPSGRYINFLSEFLAKESDATYARARSAWKSLQTLDAPKNYRAWKEWSAQAR